jgi:prolyl 4-hydroxylase
MAGKKTNTQPKQESKKSTGFPVWTTMVIVPVVIAVAFRLLRGNSSNIDGSFSTERGHRKIQDTSEMWTHGYYADLVSNAPASHARMYPNGGGGTPVLVSFGSDADFEQLGRLYNDHGQIVLSRLHFVDNTALYRGPASPGTHFQWPAGHVGLKRTVPGLFGASKLAVELETLTDPSDGKDPRVFYVHNFLTANETEHLIRFATAEENPYKIARSTAGTHKAWSQEGGREATTSTRTSMNAFDTQTAIAKDIKLRAFRLLRMGEYEESMADGIQILRYEIGEAYIAHHDYFPEQQSDDHNWDPGKGGSNRFATIFLYLSDVEYGGQTVFPKSNRLTNNTSADLVKRLGEAPSPETLARLMKEAELGENSWESTLIQQCYTQLAIPPRRGDAILFYSQRVDGSLDPSSLHGACPVLTGTKWGANLWVWNACRYSMCHNDPLQPASELSANLKAPFHD